LSSSILLEPNETNDHPTRHTVGHAFVTARDRDWKAMHAEFFL